MTLMTATLLQAQNATGGASGISFWIMIIAIFVIMYFFMIRPQNKKQKEIQKFRNSLTTGQEIVTAGGIHGTIRSINEAENTIVVEVASGVKLTFDKSSIFASSGAASTEQQTKR